MAQLVKNPPAKQETWVQSLGWEDVLEEGKTLPAEFYGLYSPLGHKELDTTESVSLGTENICAPKEIYGSLA